MKMLTKPEILYEDKDLLVCVKPAGLPVQTAKTGQNDLVSVLKNYRAKKKEEPYIGIVHRLDQPVEGVMVFAKTRRAAADLSSQVSDRRIQKEYMAVVCHTDDRGDAQPSPDDKEAKYTEADDGSLWYELHDYLIKDGKENTSKVVPKGTPGAKAASLSYTVLQHNAKTNRSLIRIRLETGRHHQIRVQFAHAGMPLYADTKYGRPLPDGIRRPVALCSCKIGFTHPSTGKKMEFELDRVPCLTDTLEKM